MTPLPTSPATPRLLTLRLGVLRLADSAPALVAQARGFFAAHGLDAEILVEPSWANILDKLTWGLLDSAIMLPPLALAAAMGLRGTRARLVVPMGLTCGGNSVVVGNEAAAAVGDQPEQAASRLLAWMRLQPARPKLAVVHLYSTHNLLLHGWLTAAGGRVDHDWDTVVVAPEQVVHALRTRQIAGFCAGAPWGELAVATGAGTVLAGSAGLWPGHPEKCLCVAGAWADAQPAGLVALTSAMLQACAICADPAQSDAVAGLLAGIGLPQDECRKALPGGGGVETIGFANPASQDGKHAFWHADARTASWFVDRMRQCDLLDPEVDVAAGAAIYRSELLLPALAAQSRPIPGTLPQ